jgi:hypothetical protein
MIVFPLVLACGSVMVAFPPLLFTKKTRSMSASVIGVPVATPKTTL